MQRRRSPTPSSAQRRRHALGDLLRDAAVPEPDPGLLHRLHSEALNVCGSEGASGAHRGAVGRAGPRGCGCAGPTGSGNPPGPARPHAVRIHCPGDSVMSGPGGDVVCSFSALGKGLSSRISKSSRRSYSLPR